MIILDDAGQYDNQCGDGWELVSIPRRFSTLGQKRNAAAALVPPDVDILCPVDDDDMQLPHAMMSHAKALEFGDWSRPSFVFEEKERGVFTRKRYSGHSASWAYLKSVYNRTTGYSFTNVGEDGGLQTQLEKMNLRVVDPLTNGLGPYLLCSRFMQYHAHTFKGGDFARVGRDCPKQKFELKIEPGYKVLDSERIVML
jgi:hypothetical protein